MSANCLSCADALRNENDDSVHPLASVGCQKVG